MSSEITEQTIESQLVGVLPPEPDPRALNGMRHGMTSEHVPPGERAAYGAHVQAVRESSGARGYLQERLADRAALALWRLDRVARYEAAVSSQAQRNAQRHIDLGKGYGPGAPVKQAYERLQELTQEPVDFLKADPALSEHWAQRFDGYGLTLERWALGGSADGLGEDEADYLGGLLAGKLQALGVSPTQLVRAMLGRAPRRGEAQDVETDHWTYEPAEVLGLLTLLHERLGGQAPPIMISLAQPERLKAQAIRDAQRFVEDTAADVLASLALPDPKELEKITRYEAHLERVLYRALHDLEAARREAKGQDSPGPLRGVLDERPQG